MISWRAPTSRAARRPRITLKAYDDFKNETPSRAGRAVRGGRPARRRGGGPRPPLGGLQEVVRAAWRVLTPAQRRDQFAQPALAAPAALPEYEPLIGHLTAGAPARRHDEPAAFRPDTPEVRFDVSSFVARGRQRCDPTTPPAGARGGWWDQAADETGWAATPAPRRACRPPATPSGPPSLSHLSHSRLSTPSLVSRSGRVGSSLVGSRTPCRVTVSRLSAVVFGA
jgi:hypothetical protein